MSKIFIKIKNNGHHASLLGALLFAVLFAIINSSKHSILPAAALNIYQPPASIASDCSKDVAHALNNWIATIPSNSMIQFAPKGCYETEETVTFSTRNNLTIDGNGSTFKRKNLSPINLQWPVGNPHFVFVNDNVLIIENMHVKGTDETSDNNLPYSAAYNQAYEFESGFDIEGDTNVTMTNDSTDGTWGDGATLTGRNQYTGYTTANVAINNLTVNKNGRQGLAITQANHVTIDNLDIVFSRRSAVDMEPNLSDNVVDMIEIKNSTLGSLLGSFSAEGEGRVNNINLHDNTLLAPGVPFVYDRASDGHLRQNWSIKSNKVLAVLGSPSPGMLFSNTTNVVVAGNTITFAPQQPTAATAFQNGSTGAQVYCNWFQTASGAGYSDNSSNPVTFYKNSTTTSPPSCLKNPALPPPPTCPTGQTGTPPNCKTPPPPNNNPTPPSVTPSPVSTPPSANAPGSVGSKNNPGVPKSGVSPSGSIPKSNSGGIAPTISRALDNTPIIKSLAKRPAYFLYISLFLFFIFIMILVVRFIKRFYRNRSRAISDSKFSTPSVIEPTTKSKKDDN
jgi:hypothetical protein